MQSYAAFFSIVVESSERVEFYFDLVLNSNIYIRMDLLLLQKMNNSFYVEIDFKLWLFFKWANFIPAYLCSYKTKSILIIYLYVTILIIVKSSIIYLFILFFKSIKSYLSEFSIWFLKNSRVYFIQKLVN